MAVWRSRGSLSVRRCVAVTDTAEEHARLLVEPSDIPIEVFLEPEGNPAQGALASGGDAVSSGS
jgi:hypothetical protein